MDSSGSRERTIQKNTLCGTIVPRARNLQVMAFHNSKGLRITCSLVKICVYLSVYMYIYRHVACIYIYMCIYTVMHTCTYAYALAYAGELCQQTLVCMWPPSRCRSSNDHINARILQMIAKIRSSLGSTANTYDLSLVVACWALA